MRGTDTTNKFMDFFRNLFLGTKKRKNQVKKSHCSIKNNSVENMSRNFHNVDFKQKYDSLFRELEILLPDFPSKGSKDSLEKTPSTHATENSLKHFQFISTLC